MTDDLSMKAVDCEPVDAAIKSLKAGCDLVLHCNGNLDEMELVADGVSDLSENSIARLKKSEALRRKSESKLNTSELSAKPGALFLPRQKTETLEREVNFDPTVIAKGGYTVSGGDEDYPDLVLISTGSEGGAVQSAKKAIEQQDVTVRHVSIPCLERFLEQSEE